LYIHKIYMITRRQVRLIIGIAASMGLIGALLNFILVVGVTCDITSRAGGSCDVTTVKTQAIVMLFAAFGLIAIVFKLLRKLR